MSGTKEGREYHRPVYRNGHASVLTLPAELGIPPETPTKITVTKVAPNGEVRELQIVLGKISYLPGLFVLGASGLLLQLMAALFA